ncbi:hypothetical protein ACIOJD_30980 [Streptomyces sp. NPDC088116]|uniref:hypothetical protein n=1 Tax=Streptomyces sp. NPDC088116 TaxID=3365825 RepID=UPI0037FC9BDC
MTAGDPQSRIPAYTGVERFVDAFDKLVVQPRRSRSRVPVVLLSEPGGGDAGRLIVAGLRSREVCRTVRKEPRTAVVWSARASQLQLFLAEIARLSGDCPQISVLGGDDVTNTMTEEQRLWDEFKGLTLFYVAHGYAPAQAADVTADWTAPCCRACSTRAWATGASTASPAASTPMASRAGDG